MHRSLALVVAFVLFLALPGTAAHAEQIDDASLHFTLTVPDDFQRNPQLTATNPDYAYVFQKPVPGDAIGVLIVIERMRGTVGREKLTLSNMPADFAGGLFTVRWHEFDVQAFEIPAEAAGTKIITYNVQIPLKSQAIQLKVIGRRDQQQQLLALTHSLLESLQGESNWLRSVAPRAVASSPVYIYIMLAVFCVSIIAGLVVLWLVRRISPRGTVLGLAVLMYATSWLLAPGTTREMRGAIGTIRMIGFLGVALGIFDLFRHPVTKPPAKEPPVAG